jgi:hypothetical protein
MILDTCFLCVYICSMKIFFEESGGFAGINHNISINSDSLHPEEVSELQRLVDDANFFDLPSEPATPSLLRGADYLEYKITIETTDNKRHSIKTTDLTMPSNIGPLIRYLRGKAVKEKKKASGSKLT